MEIELRPRRKRKPARRTHSPGKGIWPNLLIQSPNLTVIDTKELIKEIQEKTNV